MGPAFAGPMLFSQDQERAVRSPVLVRSAQIGRDAAVYDPALT